MLIAVKLMLYCYRQDKAGDIMVYTIMTAASFVLGRTSMNHGVPCIYTGQMHINMSSHDSPPLGTVVDYDRV